MEKNNQYSLELTVKGDDPVATFDALKELQEIGYAGVDSTIVYKRVRVPAGYCVDFHNFIITYGAIISGDHASIFEQVLEGLDYDNTLRFLATCTMSLEKMDREGLSKDDVINFLEMKNIRKSDRGQK